MVMRIDGQIPEGRHPFEVQSEGPIQDLVIKPVAGGYQVTGLPVALGNVKVEIALFGNMIQGSPVIATVTDPSKASPMLMGNVGSPAVGPARMQPINLQPVNHQPVNSLQPINRAPGAGGNYPANYHQPKPSQPVNPSAAKPNPTRKPNPQPNPQHTSPDDALASLLNELDNY